MPDSAAGDKGKQSWLRRAFGSLRNRSDGDDPVPPASAHAEAGSTAWEFQRPLPSERDRIPEATRAGDVGAEPKRGFLVRFARGVRSKSKRVVAAVKRAGAAARRAWHARKPIGDLVGFAAGGVLLAVGGWLMSRWHADGFSIIKLELAATPHEVARALLPTTMPKALSALPVSRTYLSNLRGQIWSDSAFFIPGYVTMIVALIRLVRGPGTTHRPWAAFGGLAAGLAVAAGVLDEIENVALWHELRAAGRAPSATLASLTNEIPTWAPKLASLCATLKFLFLFVALTYVVFGLPGMIGRAFLALASRQPRLGGLREWASRPRPAAWTRPEHLEPDLSSDVHSKSPPWRDPKNSATRPGDDWDWTKGRLGIACSGGGVRSAAVNLGALQVLREKGEFSRAAYLSAVSGGGYIAAGISYSDGDPRMPSLPPGANPETWKPRSPEEQHLRNNSSYLAPQARHKVGAILRALVGIALNLTIVWLCLFVLARPLGWTISSLHPELRARLPIVRIDKHQQVRIDPDLVTNNGTRINVEPQHGTIRLKLEDLSGTETAVAEYAFRPGRLEKNEPDSPVAVQPKLFITHDPFEACRHDPNASRLCRTVENRDPNEGYLQVEQALSVSSRGDSTNAGHQVQFRVDRQPRVHAVSGLEGREPIEIAHWMWVLVITLVAFATAITIGGMLTRTAKGDARWGRVATACATAGLTAFIMLIALPWLVQELPHSLSTLARHLPDFLKSDAGSTTSPATTYAPAVFVSGVLTAIVTAARGLFSKRPRLVGGLLAITIVYVLAGIVLITLTSYAAAYGPLGRMKELGVGWSGPQDWMKALAAVALLVGFTVIADVNAWSLYPFYKQRLQSAYLVERTSPTKVEPVPNDRFIRLDSVQNDCKPELVLCAAANISDGGFSPPGRRAVTFTFSATEIGGPEVGYEQTPEFYRRLGMNRQKDLTLPAAMAISGAAISPAMGKKSMLGFAPLLALLNVRLGVWLPHPNWVHAQDEAFVWRDKPRLQHLFMEVFGIYRFRHPYIYVTDGGHWDNLGLVELLRRGCTEIYCFDASGDQVDTFFTIGEAIALARSELGIDIRIRPDAMRPALEATTGQRNLLRWVKRKATEQACAPVAHVSGTFTFPAGGKEHEGHIVIAKAAVTDDVPWDVFAHAEKDDNFPTNSTLEQLFTDERFEAYRALGRYLGQRSVFAMKNWNQHAVLVTVPTVIAPAVAARLDPFGPTMLEEDDMRTFSIAGSDADVLFEQIIYTLGDTALPAGSYAIKRYGRPGDPEKRIKLGTNPPGWS